MACAESGGAPGDVRRERLDVDTQVGHETPDDGDSIGAAAPGIDENLRMGAGRQDQPLSAHLRERGHGGRMVRGAAVAQRDDDARVDDDYRHSRRSFFRDPFG